MSKENTVRDGRLAHCYLLEKNATKMSAGNLSPGHFYVMTKKGDSSALPDIPLLVPFYCTKAAAVAAEDEVYEYNALFLAYANNKTLNKEKSTQDVTVDKDKDYNYTTDGSVNISGSINGYDLLGSKDSAIEKIRLRFSDVLDTTEDEVDYRPAKTTVKDLVAFIWDAKDATTGTMVAIEIIPCLITTQNRSAAYQSGQSFDMDIQGCASMDDGTTRIYQKTKWCGLKSDVEDTTSAA